MCHVRIIEDEPLIAMLIQDVLEEAGATSFSFAVTEQEAVDAAHEHVPAVSASDVTLLEGAGPRAVQRILSDCGEMPVMFITATPVACVGCGTSGIVITKPVRVGELARVFHDIAPV